MEKGQRRVRLETRASPEGAKMVAGVRWCQCRWREVGRVENALITAHIYEYFIYIISFNLYNNPLR